MGALILQQTINALTVGSIYALIALGYTMVYGVLRLINFAHSELFTAGAFIGLALSGALGVAGHPMGGILVGLITFVVIGLAGVSVEIVAYRPLRRTSRLAPMLSALGMAVVIQNAVMLIGGRRPLIYPSFLPSGVIELFGAIVSYKQITIFAVAVVLMIGLELFVNRTNLGVRIRAVAENAETASLVGINPNTAISLIFFIGPGLGAVAGVLYSSFYGVATFTMGFVIGMKAFTAAILGGIGSIPGAVLGGFLLGIIETFATAWMPVLTGGLIGTEYRDIFAFSVLVLILLFRPAGLLGEHISEETMVYKSDF
ncbi:branched-chain amino acid ABC transporter permease [Ancylobacter pratisalsi]|uniref:Branched-chain amino acid ABC transporter permease n=1 Tax=Ancylobacter pratisalsi TaxID=1745854 RepID=A0A6P1YKL8_9HYPH|nr:branched-chain amino acid ABC transporter permease [Ancylobacter pratisalsi]QIB33947.1 branched-chain amino acid ABC transporter permease [Ancylobacter pratisalsi]